MNYSSVLLLYYLSSFVPLSLDRLGGNERKPQSWSRSAQVRGSPPGYIDPNGPTVVVAQSAREYVAHAYANSASFREQFDLARSNRYVFVKLSVGRNLRSQTSRGETNWAKGCSKRHIVLADHMRGYSGVIESVARGIGRERYEAKSKIDVEARLGHELKHVNELAKYGSIVNAPDFREGGVTPRMGETNSALELERAIRDELARANKALSPEELAAIFDAPTANTPS